MRPRAQYVVNVGLLETGFDITGRLRAAFPPRPIDARIETAFGPSGTSYPDAADFVLHCDGKTWEQVDRAFISRCADVLGFLKVPAVVNVLPAYLNLMLELAMDLRSSLPDDLMQLLTKPMPSDRSSFKGLVERQTKRFDELAGLLSHEQRHAIADILSRVVSDYPSVGDQAQIALDRYWSQFTVEEQ